MTPGEAIIGQGHRWEDQVANLLQARGFHVTYYGQRTVDAHTRDVVRRFHPHLAHTPDLLALNAYGEPIAIDAKWSPHNRSGDLHAVNNLAREGFADFANHYGALSLFAFNHDGDRLGFMNVADWHKHNPQPGPITNNGTGKPYQLVECNCWFPDWPRPG